MSRRYTRAIYSEETKEYWKECQERAAEFAKKHTNATIKDYEVSGYTIRCIQRKYDSCMKKENEYGIQVWICNPDDVKVDEVFEKCIANDWFNNPTEANERFKAMKAMCY